MKKEEQFLRSNFFLSCRSPEYKWKTLEISKPINGSLKSAAVINSSPGDIAP